MFRSISRKLIIAYGATALTAAFALGATPKVAQAGVTCWFCICGDTGPCACSKVPCKPV